jgi:uncharacterized protein YcgL (UPF0745 family)
MIADIYRTNRSDVFLLVPTGNTLDIIPSETAAGLGRLTFLNTRNLDDPLLSVDASGINSELASQGFSVC